MKAFAKRFWTETGGQDLVEYALLIALVALTAALAVGGFGTVVRDVWDSLVTRTVTVLS